MQTLKLGYHFEQDAYGYSATGASVDPLSGVQTPEAGLTDVFDYLQDINALYASYDWTVGRWSYRAGLRGETTRTDGRQLTQVITTAYNYARLFPSLHVERQIDERSTVSLGASRRITRPDPSNLNPYIDYEYTPNLRAGNANLRPQYTDSFELGYTYDTSGSTYSMDGYYRRNTDSVTDITENLGKGLALSTKTNLPLNDAAGVEFTVSAHPLRSLSLTLSGNAFYNQIDAEALGFAGLRSTTGLNGKLKLAYQPTKADTVELVATRTDKQLTPQGEIDAINIVNLGYRHGFSSSLKASIWISDLFEGQHLHRVAVTPTFTDTYQRTVVGRVIWFGLAYTFGRTSHEQPAKFDYDQ
jgi:outer membrane receptor protein involved in Fe transport